MAHITTCSKCGALYEESSEERANERSRFCGSCWKSATCTRSVAAETWGFRACGRPATRLIDGNPRCRHHAPGYMGDVNGPGCDPDTI